MSLPNQPNHVSRLNQLPSNRPAPDVVQFDFHVVARLHDLANFRLENDLLEVVGAAAQFRLVAHGVLFHQQLLGAAEHHLVPLERDGVLQFHEARVALVLFLFGKRLGFLVRFGALARAVDEHESAVELARFKCLVEKEIQGELQEKFSLIRQIDKENGKPIYEMQTYFLVDEEAATQARIRAYENALKESEAAQKMANKIGDFVKAGFE